MGEGKDVRKVKKVGETVEEREGRGGSVDFCDENIFG